MKFPEAGLVVGATVEIDGGENYPGGIIGVISRVNPDGSLVVKTSNSITFTKITPSSVLKVK